MKTQEKDNEPTCLWAHFLKLKCSSMQEVFTTSVHRQPTASLRPTLCVLCTHHPYSIFHLLPLSSHSDYRTIQQRQTGHSTSALRQRVRCRRRRRSRSLYCRCIFHTTPELSKAALSLFLISGLRRTQVKVLLFTSFA